MEKEFLSKSILEGDQKETLPFEFLEQEIIFRQETLLICFREGLCVGQICFETFQVKEF